MGGEGGSAAAQRTPAPAPALAPTLLPDDEPAPVAGELTLYVASHCFGCDRALKLAQEAADRFPAWRVAVVDLDDPHAEAPPTVFATPTWVANGRVHFRGNPAPAELWALMAHEGGPSPAGAARSEP
jgi:hypothetical protein